MTSKPSNTPRQASSGAADENNEPESRRSGDKNQKSSNARQLLPTRNTSGQERKLTDKIKQQKADEAAAAERIRVDKERKARRVRARQRIEDDEEDENETGDEGDNGFVDTTFTTRTVVSKPQAIKEKALAPRSSRVPLSNVRNDTPRRQSDNEEHIERGRTIQRVTQRHMESPTDHLSHSPKYFGSHSPNRSSSHSPNRFHSQSTSSSRSCSPVSLTGQKRRSSSVDSFRQVKAPRCSTGGRPKAADYNDKIRAILSHATKGYRCKISSTYAFPGTAQVITFSTESWAAACQHLDIHEHLTPRITRVILKGNSQLRGELKTKTRPLVEAFFGFGSGSNKKTIKKNRRLAEFLKETNNFIYSYLEFDTNNETPTKRGIYQSWLIQKIVNRMWFVNQRDEGILFDADFNPLTKQCLALVLTAIEACIDEWMTGTHVEQSFKAADYKAIYDTHIKELDRFEQHTIKHALLERILIRLYNRGRFHAGAQPMSTIGFPIIPDSAFDDAIREYEEGSDTDTDGESGNMD